ncbi:MAG: hypothetical protein B7Y07_06555 [Halothiobacillus sp. 24-54-40]|jgi:hypothetical protein|nr:MAG: hypothetical protein B7X12_10525 [Halothiobacillus sp. 20-53-49]OYY37753.1 MAG: hypothetical protein B7Y58_06010 [Halothiobacillus sp. 35-54-62]OYY52368.1 MAG: hypothetical protein B7Y53_08175 [Halothiobacillus sp. 28-55-5]OYZ86845.1 MAG: hypothetical protein B7Y07_06555 [Halothiobacillus sp. 24-54-40]OZA81018.1 MAG: hypothetical protein B7X64_03550 [Halothiobacillus sp. 39-53-45]HQS02509.1 hypothetical protein [Halothiobacillus sp.]
MGVEPVAALPPVVRERMALLEQLGEQVEAEAHRWLADEAGGSSDAALKGMEQARRAIELTVDLALSHQVENHPALFLMRQAWVQRFAKIAAAIAQKQQMLAESSQHHVAQTRAAQAYIGIERLG